MLRSDLQLRDAQWAYRVGYVRAPMSRQAWGRCAHQRAARASAIPTPPAESPPTTEASHTTSRASSRTDFHIGGLPPLRGRSTARAGHWFLARAPYHRNFAWYGTAHKPSSLPSNPRAQTTDVFAVGPNLARVSDGATPLLDCTAAIAPPTSRVKLGCGTEQHYARLRGRRRQMKEPSITTRLRSALQQRLDIVLHEPLPKRWVNLIHELNERDERERKEAQARQTKIRRRRERQ